MNDVDKLQEFRQKKTLRLQAGKTEIQNEILKIKTVGLAQVFNDKVKTLITSHLIRYTAAHER